MVECWSPKPKVEGSNPSFPGDSLFTSKKDTMNHCNCRFKDSKIDQKASNKK